MSATAADRIRSRGLKLTAQRRLVLEAVESAGGRHLSADDVFNQVCKQYPGFQRSTAYRVLDQLQACGLLHQSRIGNAPAKYHAGESHNHLICVECGLEIDIASGPFLDVLQRQTAAPGFEFLDAEIVVRGVCGNCRTVSVHGRRQ
jgi:Fe2+ or Zn2+ uptake regulation protein